MTTRRTPAPKRPPRITIATIVDDRARLHTDPAACGATGRHEDARAILADALCATCRMAYARGLIEMRLKEKGL